MQARILARLNQGAAGGELPDDADLKGLAAFYTTVLHGMSIQARGAPDAAGRGAADHVLLGRAGRRPASDHAPD